MIETTKHGIWRATIGAVVAVGLALTGLSALAADAHPAEVVKPEYDVRTSSRGGAAGQATLVVTVLAKGPHHVNKEYPTRVTVTAPAGVEVPKPKLGKGDARYDGEAKMTFEVPVKVAKAGAYDVASTVKFSVCTDEVCLLKEETVSARVVVE